MFRIPQVALRECLQESGLPGLSQERAAQPKTNELALFLTGRSPGQALLVEDRIDDRVSGSDLLLVSCNFLCREDGQEFCKKFNGHS
jgi:hypothetical protein